MRSSRIRSTRTLSITPRSVPPSWPLGCSAFIGHLVKMEVMHSSSLPCGVSDARHPCCDRIVKVLLITDLPQRRPLSIANRDKPLQFSDSTPNLRVPLGNDRAEAN